MDSDTGNQFDMWSFGCEAAHMESDYGRDRDRNDSGVDFILCFPKIFYAVCGSNGNKMMEVDWHERVSCNQKQRGMLKG